MPSALEAKLRAHVERIYPHEDAAALAERIAAAFYEASTVRRRSRIPGNTLWSQKDAFVITYADSMVDGEHVPLDLLNDFLLRRLSETTSCPSFRGRPTTASPSPITARSTAASATGITSPASPANSS